MENENIYETRDLYIASLIVTKGFELVNINFQLDGRASRVVGIFQFNSTPEILQLESDYLNNKEITFAPARYVANFKNLKAKVNNNAKNPSLN